MKKSNFASFLVIFLLTGTSLLAQLPGDLDTTFGSGGKVYNLPTNFTPAEDVAIQPDGKLVLAGTTIGPDMTQDFAVVRLNSDGSPDTGFGSNGLVGIPFNTGFIENGIAVVIQSDGKIVVAGNVQLGTTGWDFGVARLNSNGTLDTTYNGGKVKVDISSPGGDDFVFDMIKQPNDMVVITGTTRPTPNKDIAIVRLTTAGTPDPGFNNPGGRLRIAIGDDNEDEGLALAFGANGAIIIAGSTAGDFCLLRFTPNGTLDQTFGFMGLVQTPIGTQNDRATSVLVQPDGNILAAGTANSGSFDEVAFARYLTTGQPDTTFDTDGKVTYDVRAMSSDLLTSALLQGDGKIIGVGSSSGAYILVRLTPTGGLDNTFGTGGKVVANVAPEAGGSKRAILQPDGKVVAVGDGSGPGTSGFTAARFLTSAAAAPPVPFDFDGDRKTDIGIFRPSVGEWWINHSSTGSTVAFQFGVSTDNLVPGDYTGDGKSDIALSRVLPSNNREWFILRSEDFTYYSFPFGTILDTPTPADFDGDRKTDAAVYRPAARAWFVLSSATGQTSAVQFGAVDDIPIPADYDGDGRADIAIFRPSNGQWWINRTTDGLIVHQFGNSTDKLVPGDYTGDGQADVALWRPSTGEWFILRSEDITYYSAPFGASTDLPAPGDYDGDGRFDITVFRPSNSTWYSQRTTSGTIIQQFGTGGDRPIPNAYVP